MLCSTLNKQIVHNINIHDIWAILKPMMQIYMVCTRINGRIKVFRESRSNIDDRNVKINVIIHLIHIIPKEQP